MTDSEKQKNEQNIIYRDEEKIAQDLKELSGINITVLTQCSRTLSAYPAGIIFILAIKMYIMYPVYKEDPNVYIIDNAIYIAVGLVIIVSIISRSKLSRLFYILTHFGLCLVFPLGTIWGFLGLILIWGSKELWGINRMTSLQVEAEYKHRLYKYGRDYTDENGTPL